LLARVAAIYGPDFTPAATPQLSAPIATGDLVFSKGDTDDRAQPSAPVVACTAPEWCGVLDGDKSDPRRARFMISDGKNWVSKDHRHYCSLACRDAKHTPLAAQPACPGWCGEALPDDGAAVYGFVDGPGDEREFFKLSGATCRRKGYVLGWCSMECRDKAAQPAEAKRCMGQCMENVGTFDRPAWKVCAECGVKITAQIAAAKEIPKPAEQPKSAKGPVCQAATGRCPDAPKTRIIMDYIRKKPLRVEWCDPCALAYEQHHVTTAQYGKPYTGPERIVKPPMAHSSQWADEAEDA
jgi:hypothetical protein